MTSLGGTFHAEAPAFSWAPRAAAPPVLAPDSTIAQRFLDTTLGSAIHLVAIVPDVGTVWGRWFGEDARAAAAWAADRNGEGANLYWTVNEVVAGLNTKPSKGDIRAARFAHVDIDPPKDGRTWTPDAVADELADLPAAPSFIIDSGGGLQAFWRLEEETARLADIEAVNQGIRDRFGADACWNIDRLMRLPGTVNWPDARKRARGRRPALARLLADDDGTLHDPGVLARDFPRAAPTAEAAPRPDVRAAPAELITADSLGLAPFDPLRMMIEQPPGQDRSGDALACAGELVRAGYSDEQVMGLLLNPANAVSAHCFAQRDPNRAAARCLSRARGDEARAAAERAAGAEAAQALGFRGVIEAPPAERRAISATPYLGRAPGSIPLRPWVYGRYLLRKTVTAVVAPGGVGKSSLMAGTALALATGRAVLGVPVWDGPMRVWLWNLEDDGDELARQIEAACIVHEITPDEYRDRLFIDSGLDGARLCTTRGDRNSVQVDRRVMDELAQVLIDNRIDVLIVDPFVSSHQVDENDNARIDAIAKAWAEIATRAHCSVVLVHHAKKLDGKKVTSEASRGGSALVSATRSTMVLNRMDPDEAKSFGIPPGQQRRYFSVGDDKHNRAPAERADWYRMQSVGLGNGGLEGGDSVGVVVPWTPPQADQEVTPDQLRRVQVEVSQGTWRQDFRAKGQWVGHAVALVLGIDPDGERLRITKMVDSWIASGHLTRVVRRDETRQNRPYIEIGKVLVDTGAPVISTGAE